MPRRPSRLLRSRGPVLLVAALVLAAGLAGCGSDDTGQDGAVNPLTGEGGANRLDAVDIGGEPGTAPTLSWKAIMQAAAPRMEVLDEGDGEPLAKGDTAYVNFLLADGYTQKTLVDSYGPELAGPALTIGSPPTQATGLSDLVSFTIASRLKAGVTPGTRIAITGSAEQVFGSNLQLQGVAPQVATFDLGYSDAVLILADVEDVAPLDGPDGTQQKQPAWFPTIDFSGGEPSGLDFAGTPAPDGQLRSALLKRGTGDRVEKGDQIVVDYLGQIPGADAPFDESYSRDMPLTSPIGLDQLVGGWDKKLPGVPVGSRVLLEIPPKEGYGSQGGGEDIPPGSTLYFVIDVLASY